MTTGALVFAYNNERIDYLRMAEWSARNIRRHLGIPVAVVTDQTTDLDFDRVIHHATSATDSRWFSDIDQRVIWHNRSRVHAFELSPWDQTLVIDADYVVASDTLKSVLALHTTGVLCHRWAQDITSVQDFVDLNHFGQYRMPMAWATVMIFNRDSESQKIFQCMAMVRDHWNHYRAIYHDRSKIYRNDHALAIALNIVHGHQQDIVYIPWPLITALPEHRVSQVDRDRYRVDYTRPDNRRAWIEVEGQDLHVMGKSSLMDMIA